MINYDEYKEWFINYTNDFLSLGDVPTRFAIDLKIKHTFDTVSAMESIIKDMNFNREDYNLAKVIALFHDVGRFNQLKNYGHFVDRKSIDHADESVRVLEEQNVLKDLDEVTKNIVYIPIKNHNKIEINKDVTDERTLLYSKLIRDADKVDIYRVVTNKLKTATDEELASMYYELEYKAEVTDNIYNKAMNGDKISNAEMVTIADSVASNMLWCISDIYFKESLRIIYDNKLIQDYYEVFKSRYETENYDERLEEIYRHVISEFERMISN